MNKSKILISTAVAALLLPGVSWGLGEGHELELVGRALYWNDTGVRNQVSRTSVSYEQSGVGVQANYRSPFWADTIGFDATLLGVVKIDDHGNPTTSILEVRNNGQVDDSFATLSQALVKIRFNRIVEVKLGRQTQNSLLLRSSTTRAAPDTFSGATFDLTPFENFRIYGAVYDRWRARSNPDFEKFKTESTAAGVPNAIDYVAIGGARYASGPYEISAEYLNSKDYLAKYGIVASYRIPSERNSLKLSGGVFGSRDAGNLFVCGAEREVDCRGIGRIDNDTTGIYLDVEWTADSLSVGGAVSTFDGLWIEDNFAANAARTGLLNQDHGTNPFPTSSIMGPDFANNDETAWSVRLAYDWKMHAPGFKTNLKYVKGTGARSSNLSNAAEGKEDYREITLRYAPPSVKNLVFTYAYGDYGSHVDNYSATTNIKGLTRSSWQLHRVYLDYVYKF